jgi:short-subunit dehydrogenase involved in D-alanine esterification of teichoic acids
MPVRFMGPIEECSGGMYYDVVDSDDDESLNAFLRALKEIHPNIIIVVDVSVSEFGVTNRIKINTGAYDVEADHDDETIDYDD